MGHPDLNPPGFENLSKEEQIEYVQELWNTIAADQEDVPVPQWHLEILRQRAATLDEDGTTAWEDVKDRLENRSRG